MSTVSLIQKLIISFIHGMFHFENHPGGHKQIIRCKLNPFMKNELILIRVWLHSRLYILSDDILWNLEKTKYMPSLVHQRKNMEINIITNIKKRQTTTDSGLDISVWGMSYYKEITIYVKLKFYQMLPVTVAHHVKILTISFLIVINIQIIRKYYLIVLIGYLLTLILM